MKKTLLALLSVLTLHSAVAQNNAKTSPLRQSAGSENTANLAYTFSQQTATFEFLSGATSLNSNSIWDDPTFIIPMPFTFSVQGQQVDSLLLDGLGGTLAGLRNGVSAFTIIAPFDVDLIDRGYDSSQSLSPISYKVDGAVGSRILKIEWKEAGSYAEFSANGGILTNYISFQAWIYEGTNVIEYRYGNNTINNPTLFYDGDPGAFIGTGIVDGNNVVANLLSGMAASPSLSLTLGAVNGTPVNGTVYRFTPLSGSSSVSENNLADVINAWPNPVNDILQLELKQNGAARMSLYNLQGQKVKQMMFTESRASLDLSDLPAGAYLLRLEGHAGSLRLIKR